MSKYPATHVPQQDQTATCYGRNSGILFAEFRVQELSHGSPKKTKWGVLVDSRHKVDFIQRLRAAIVESAIREVQDSRLRVLDS